jgi:hypothetical protein
MAINQSARNFTLWPYGPDTKAQVDTRADGAQILLKSYNIE